MRCRPQIARIIFLGGAQAATESPQDTDLVLPRPCRVLCPNPLWPDLAWAWQSVVTAVVKVLFRLGMHRSSAMSAGASGRGLLSSRSGSRSYSGAQGWALVWAISGLGLHYDRVASPLLLSTWSVCGLLLVMMEIGGSCRWRLPLI